MSSGSRITPGPPAKRQRVTLTKLAEKKALGEPIVMVTAYDYPSAQVAEEAGVDVVLVGDSGAMTVLGYPSTVPVTIDEMLMLCSAVRRGLSTPLLVGDLPFASYEASNEQAIRTAQRFIKEAGCDAVKLERGGSSVERARGDRGRRYPRDGPRGPYAADRHRPRRLPLAGPHRGPCARGGARRDGPRRRPAASRSCSRPCRRRSRRTCTSSSRSRSSASAPARPLTARCSCSTTCSASSTVMPPVS